MCKRAAFNSTPATTQKVSALYIAFFARTGDFDGLGFWKNVARDSALNDLALMQLMSGRFANHPSFSAIYGSLSNSAYVDAIYLNIGGKPADAAGKAYWLGQLNGGMSRADMVANFVFGLLELSEAELQAMYARGEITWTELQDALARKNRVANKTEVATAFLRALGSATNLSPGTNPQDPASLAADPAYRASQNIIRSVTEDSATKVPPLNYLAGSPTIDGINQFFGP